mgnify:FL=1|jgi:uncharacterized protein YqeY
MSALKDQLRSDMTAAMKARDSIRTQTLRMVMTAVSNAEVAGKASRELADDDVVAILVSEHKKRKEAAEAFEQGNRPELAQKERDEAAVISEYLPEPLTDEEIVAIVAASVADANGAELGMKAMGQVMGAVTAQTRGRADGAAVAAEVRKQLAN